MLVLHQASPKLPSPDIIRDPQRRRVYAVATAVNAEK